MEVTFREALPSDKETLLLLEQQVVEAERPYNADIRGEGAYYYNIDELIASEQACLLVGLVGDQIVATGYAQLRESKGSLVHDKHSYLGFMLVLEEFRGLGINKLIMDLLLTWSRDQGASHVYLDVYDENESAVKAYKKVGFEKSLVEMKLKL